MENRKKIRTIEDEMVRRAGLETSEQNVRQFFFRLNNSHFEDDDEEEDYDHHKEREDSKGDVTEEEFFEKDGLETDQESAAEKSDCAKFSPHLETIQDVDSYLILRRPLGSGVVPLRIHLKPQNSPIVIGRGSKADVFLYAGEHPSFVSRNHAKLDYGLDGKWIISDLESVNGMFFNSQKLERDEKPLNYGDRVYFGNPQHSFFVEYEYVTSTNQNSCSDNMDSSSEYSNCSTSLEPNSITSSLSLNPYLPGSALSYLDPSDDLWSSRIFTYLDFKELFFAQLTCTSWMSRGKTTIQVMSTIRWRHPWPVDRLVQILEEKASIPGKPHPVTTLITQGCYKVRDDHVEKFSRAWGEHLTHIDFSGTPTLTARGMHSIAQNCPRVKTLIVRGCKRVGGGNWDWMDQLVKGGTLEHCDFHCAGANDFVVSKVASNSPNLKRFDLGIMCAGGVTDAGLFDLVEHCPLLEHLDLRGCKHVTDEGVMMLVQRCGSNLKTLVLHSCQIGDESLKNIGKYCLSLQSLDVHRCTRITDYGVCALAKGKVAKSLKKLDLSNVTITDVALKHLALYCSSLTSLDLRSCKEISGKGLVPLVRSISKTLLSLDINGCSKIRPVDTIEIAHICVGVLQILEIGGREEECVNWPNAACHVEKVKEILGKKRVHDAFAKKSEDVVI